MPKLILKFKNNPIQNYDIGAGQSITIGRLEDNDIVIENLAVSGHHAKVDSVGEGYLLTDLQSKNGCFVNEKMVASHWLSHGDVVSIGKHLLEFSLKEGEKPPAAPQTSQRDQTMVMDTGHYRDLMDKSEPAGRSGADTGKPVGMLSYLAGGEGEVELSRKLIKIGKDGASDIVVSGLTVGATSATISKRPKNYVLSYVSGLSKPKVNGKAVKQSVALNEFDVIEIGSVKLQFFTKE
ncbi:MAG: FHA domain-containing protein [Desulfobacterales bacterium]|nr:FHA domain-containing protein [Desulfobacterales bacterium]MDJ0884539.1 FHA domain-containing protein [Desulfobacterales bacterium]